MSRVVQVARFLRSRRRRGPIWTELCFRFYAWAAKEIHPLHPDAGHVCITHNELRIATGRKKA